MYMACLNMLNNEQQNIYNAMGPRISFSSDFVDTQHTNTASIKHESCYREAPVSSDFEFSMSGRSMISADELFFNGKMMPLKGNCNNKMTLRDELLVDDDQDQDQDFLPRLPKNPSRWMERLGLKRNHYMPKKIEENDAAFQMGGAAKKHDLVHEIHANFNGGNRRNHGDEQVK